MLTKYARYQPGLTAKRKPQIKKLKKSFVRTHVATYVQFNYSKHLIIYDLHPPPTLIDHHHKHNLRNPIECHLLLLLMSTPKFMSEANY